MDYDQEYDLIPRDEDYETEDLSEYEGLLEELE